ncbi:hypothetical protein [Nocardioides solisilvae]|uniref:hypothetical protein n=1 Tax=Nocardioides solisilvae TaxID=1542435 RepID=UPI000D742D75|nr:hypothetical protein [Nocardioides solisilvae]
MTTELKRFTEAYATLTVATYEPLILRWVSLWGLSAISTDLATRQPKLKQMSDLPLAIAMGGTPRQRAGVRGLKKLRYAGEQVNPSAYDADGVSLPSGLVARADDAQVVGDPVTIGRIGFARGVTRRVTAGLSKVVEVAGDERRAAAAEAVASVGVAGRDLAKALGRRRVEISKTTSPEDIASYSAVQTVPVVLNPQIGTLPDDFDLPVVRRQIFGALVEAVDKALAADPRKLVLDLNPYLKDKSFAFIPVKVEEALSPVGVAHFYRQLYFNVEEGVGPLEQAFTVAPLETLEVVYESSRKQIHEEQLEQGSEEVSEIASEVKNLDEVSDKVSSMIQRDSSAAMSVSASGGVGVWQASAEASADMKVSSQRSREETSRRLKEVTTRASERITKTFTLKTRDVTEITSSSMTRRVIRNDSADPVSYGLRRVLRRVRVKVQDLGPQLVWQVYVCEPGTGLARSRFVHFRTPSEVAQPDVPPGSPPRPAGGTDTGTTSSDVGWDASKKSFFVTLVVAAGSGRTVKAVAIDSITDLEGGGKDDLAPSPRNGMQWDASWNATTGTYTVKIGILEGDSASVSLTYTYQWEPSPAVVAAWEDQVEALRAEADEARLQQQFEREKALITETSRIRTRPPADLRREERYEVLNRMISTLFGRGDDPSMPTPLEIEYFHRFFDIESMFTYTHPSWWRPRYAPVATGLARSEYAITADSEPAPMGSSLGWMIQLDGDTRRNEFINSPWIRACLPIRKGREREALAWLATHVEGERGYDPDKQPLKGVLDAIAARRAAEGGLGVDGPEYVTADTAVADAGIDPAQPEGIFPVVDEFDVTLPTDGFVYERLDIAGGS